MAMIKCPECGKDVSDKANKCIGCGYPYLRQSSPYMPDQLEPNNQLKHEFQYEQSPNESNILIKQEELPKKQDVHDETLNIMQSNKKKKLWVFIILIAAVVISGFLIIIGLGTTSEEPDIPQVESNMYNWGHLYEHAEFERFDVDDSWHILNGTLIYITGTVREIIDDISFNYLLIEDEDGNDWLAQLSSRVIENDVSTLVGRSVTVFGNFSGGQRLFRNRSINEYFPTIDLYRYIIDGEITEILWGGRDLIPIAEYYESQSFEQRNKPFWTTLYDSVTFNSSRFRTPATLNGLDGSLIQVLGRVAEIDELDDFYVLTIHETLGDNWVVRTFDKNKDRFDVTKISVDSHITIYGMYEGIATLYNDYPIIMLLRFSVDNERFETFFQGESLAEHLESLTFEERRSRYGLQANQEYELEQESNSIEETPDKKHTYENTVSFKGLEITFLNEVEWILISDEFSVFRIPMTITNATDERSSWDTFNEVYQFGPSGAESRVGNSARHQFNFQAVWELNFINYDLGRASSIVAGETIDTYMHFKYDGVGDYVVEFNSRQEKIDFILPVEEKPQRPTHTPTKPPSGINEETYKHLRIGMSEVEVLIIMGIEPSSEHNSTFEILSTRTTTKILDWSRFNPYRSITVTLSGSSAASLKVTALSSTNLE